MPEPSTEVRRINWSECFPFTLLFRTFRMAIHPSKLALALTGIVLTGVLGWVLDAIWPGSQEPLPGEVQSYWHVPDIETWREAKYGQNVLTISSVLAEAQLIDDKTDWPKEYRESPRRTVDQLEDKLEEQYESRLKKAREEIKDAKTLNAVQADLGIRYDAMLAQLRELRPRGIFRSFLGYERSALRFMLEAAARLDFTGGMPVVLGAYEGRAVDVRELGAIPYLVLAMRGKQWIATQHPFFFLLFGVGALSLWALIGGAICRMAALNVARDERTSVKSSLGFATRKFLSFVSAPLLPIGLIVAIGLLLMLLGLFMTIPWLGDLVGGVAVLFALAGGFVMALVVIGAVGGGAMLWPTIAVEGSDGFDAMSRSYSYVYSKPWRTAFLVAVGLVYGGICYFFVRLIIFLVLATTRCFVGLPLTWISRPGLGHPVMTKLNAIWPAPTFKTLGPLGPEVGLTSGDHISAFFIGLWVSLMICLLGAFVISFFFSGSTIIYYLLRREVDATDFEDVYLDEEEDVDDGAARRPEPQAKMTSLPIMPSPGPQAPPPAMPVMPVDQPPPPPPPQQEGEQQPPAPT